MDASDLERRVVVLEELLARVLRELAEVEARARAAQQAIGRAGVRA